MPFLALLPIVFKGFKAVTGVNDAMLLKLGIALFAIFAAYMAGVIHEKAHDESKALRATIATMKQDVSIAENASTTADRQAATLRSDAEANQLLIERLRNDLANEHNKPPMEPVQCPASPKATVECKPPRIDRWRLERLRKLRGSAAAGAKPAGGS